MMTPEAEFLYYPRRREDNLNMLEALLSAATSDEHQAAFAQAQEYFHPSFLAECDYRARFIRNELWEPIAHKAITVYLATLIRNASSRKPYPSISTERFTASLGDYRSKLDGTSPTLADHLSVAKQIQDSVLASAPTCGPRLAEIVAESLSEIALCKGGSELVAIVKVAIENAIFLLLDAPATRIDSLTFLFERREAEEAGIATPITSVENSQQFDDLLSWLREFREASNRAGFDQLSDVLSQVSIALGSMSSADLPSFDGEWSWVTAHCARCSMNFSAKSPSILDETCSSINNGSNILFFRRMLNRAACIFCGLESQLESPGFLYWRARNLIVYRLPLVPLSEEESVELYRPVIESMREGYLARLSDAQRNNFENSVEIIAHGWEEWLYAVQMGDVIPEDHVAIVITVGDGSRILLDSSKLFMRELGPDEYINIDPDVRRHLEAQYEELDHEVVDQIAQQVIESVKAKSKIDIIDETSDN